MGFDNERLETLRQQVYNKGNIKSKLEVIYKRKHDLEAELEKLDKARIKEQKDVERLEKVSLASILCSIAGNKVEKLNKEKDEAYEAAVKYDSAYKEFTDVCENIRHYQEQYSRIIDLEKEYEAAINEKFTYLRQSGNPQAEEIMRLDDMIGRMDNDITEIDEAIAAGKKATATAHAVVAALEKAEGWGEFDVFASGSISAIAKHSALDDAQKQINTLRIQLGNLRTELADVRVDSDIRIEVDDFDRIADYFFDCIFTDWSVLKKIRDSLTQARNTRDKIVSVTHNLTQMREQLKTDIKETRAEIEKLIINAAL